MRNGNQSGIADKFQVSLMWDERVDHACTDLRSKNPHQWILQPLNYSDGMIPAVKSKEACVFATTQPTIQNNLKQIWLGLYYNR